MNTAMHPAFSLANAHAVTDQLGIGGDLDTTRPDLAKRQLDELCAAGLTTIVDVRIEWDDAAFVRRHAPHVLYRYLGVDYAGQRMPDAWFDAGTRLVLESMADSGATVLVHCHMGINRGPSLGFATLLALGWEEIGALDAIRSARPIAYVGYAEDAVDWSLRGKGATTSERAVARRRLARWRRDNHVDLADVIRKIGATEGSY